MGRRKHQSGFSFIEVAMAITIAGGLLTTVSSLLGTSYRLVAEEKVRMEATEHQRQGLEAISNALRAADQASLNGFDGNVHDKATVPAFRRVTGAVGETPTLGAGEWIEWRASGTPVSGVANPGAVWLDSPTGDRLLAQNVPAGGFDVVRQGLNLVIRLETYATQGSGSPVFLTRWAVVFVRNAP